VVAFVRILLPLVALTLLCARGAPAQQSLPRHGILGAVMADRDGHATIGSLIPGSAAAAAGLQPGDAVLSVDGVAVGGVRAFVAALRRPAGRSAALAVQHGAALRTVRVVLGAPPDERDPLVETVYGAVSLAGSLRRTLVTLPRNAGGRRPAVLIVGGIGCFSVDVASNQEDPYLNLARDLGRRGVVAMRLEKSGVGDSEGPPCSTVDFTTEAASYDAALRALQTNPHVDPTKVYVFGHSIGSVIAPRIALAAKLAGVIAAEGVGRDWFEYELLNARDQIALAGSSPEEVDAAMLDAARCKYRALLTKDTVERILHDAPACADYVQYPVPLSYVQEVAALNVAEPWEKLNAPALIIYGTADFVTQESDHRRIVAIVQAKHPGNATLQLIDGMDHYLTAAGSREASFARIGKHVSAPYDHRFSETILQWLCAREHCV
jgi:uncharacterized protein